MFHQSYLQHLSNRSLLFEPLAVKPPSLLSEGGLGEGGVCDIPSSHRVEMSILPSPENHTHSGYLVPVPKAYEQSVGVGAGAGAGMEVN